MQYRNITNPDFILPVSHQNNFTWNRYYDLRFDLTRSLKLDFSAVNASRIGDPLKLNTLNQGIYELRRDSIWRSILEGGRNTHYHHTWNATYTLPINKIPLLEWTSASAVYQAGYDWNLAPVTRGDYQLGNSISNMNSIQLNGQLDFIQLYSKVPYLRRVNQKYSEFSRGRRRARKTAAKDIRVNKIRCLSKIHGTEPETQERCSILLLPQAGIILCSGKNCRQKRQTHLRPG